MALFRTEKPKPFTFTPRFYDPRKEDLENRIGEIKKEMEENTEGQYVPNIRGQMRKRHDALYGVSPKQKNSLISRRLITIIIVGMILVIGYYILRMLAMADKI
ncbi:MAG: hypothetical protein WC699_15635 [Bacteroidales bacterium]|jgi:hypothetical protein